MAEKVRDFHLQSRRILKDLDDLIQRARYGASAKQASDVAALMQEVLGESADVVKRWIKLPGGRHAVVVYINALADEQRIERFVIQPLSRWQPQGTNIASIEQLQESGIFVGEATATTQTKKLIAAVLHGDAIIACDGVAGGLIVAVRGAKARGVEEPAVELTPGGPRDSFTETAPVNVALIRRRLADHNLRVRRHQVGARSGTALFVLYIDDVVNRTALNELERRLAAVEIDAILDSGMLEQLIEDTWWSPFPQLERSERPDIVASSLLEGRLCVVVDNSPLVIIAPTTLDSLFHSPQDMYARTGVVTILRTVRFIASFFALVLPSLYVAVAAFNPELLPVKMAIKIANSREGVALPVVAEALLIQLFLEILREAGFRLPGPIGQIFGIVGGIVLGDLGVRSGLVSEMMVVVIALTAISSFSAPSLALGTSIRLLGLPLLLSAVLGIFGLVIGLSAVLAHLVTLKSLGIPYLVPYAYYPPSDFKDTIVRASLPAYHRRPTFYGPQQRIRLKDHRDDRYTAAGRVHVAAEDES